MVFTFANGVEIYSEDNSVGINVTQPRRTFDINGDLGVSRNIFIGTSINDSNNLGKICINTTDTSISFYNNSNDGMVIPVGNITQRVGITGTIRYNTDTLSFEGYDGTNWGSLGGVKDVDQDTYISAESNPGSDNDELKFYTGGNETMIIDSSGKIGIGITNPSTSLHISSTNTLVIPVGDITQRIGVTGGIRYNTDLLSFEGYDGANWGSLGGVKDVDQDTYISAESNPGSDNDELKFYTGGNERMFIGSTGNIGIGTDNPINGKLEIVGSDGLVSLDYESYTSITPTRIQTGVTATNSYSIYADGKIAASEFNSISDKRVKEIIDIRDVKKDLKYINDVNIYKFNYIDKVSFGNRSKIGFMAQELEEYNSNFVNYSTNYIPNIYNKFNIKTESNGHVIKLDKDYDLKKGDILRVQVVCENRKKLKDLEIVEIDIKNNIIKLEKSKNLKKVNEVFLYGKKVYDFRTINWDQIIAVNSNFIKKLYNDNIKMNDIINNQNNEIELLKERLLKIEKFFN